MPHLPVFSELTEEAPSIETFPNIDGARQCCVVDKTLGKLFLSANWARAKSLCWQIMVAHLTNDFASFTPVQVYIAFLHNSMTIMVKLLDFFSYVIATTVSPQTSPPQTSPLEQAPRVNRRLSSPPLEANVQGRREGIPAWDVNRQFADRDGCGS